MRRAERVAKGRGAGGNRHWRAVQQACAAAWEQASTHARPAAGAHWLVVKHWAAGTQNWGRSGIEASVRGGQQSGAREGRELAGENVAAVENGRRENARAPTRRGRGTSTVLLVAGKLECGGGSAAPCGGCIHCMGIWCGRERRHFGVFCVYFFSDAWDQMRAWECAEGCCRQVVAPRAALQCSRIGEGSVRDSSPHTAWCGRRSASISDRWLSRLSRVHSSLMASSSCAEPAVQAGKRPKSGTIGRQSQLQTCGEATRKVRGLGGGVHGQPARGTVPLGTAGVHPQSLLLILRRLKPITRHTLFRRLGAPHLDHVVIGVVEEQLFHQHAALHHLLPHKGDAA